MTDVTIRKTSVSDDGGFVLAPRYSWEKGFWVREERQGKEVK